MSEIKRKQGHQMSLMLPIKTSEDRPAARVRGHDSVRDPSSGEFDRESARKALIAQLERSGLVRRK
jgi:hypothetical protein